MIGLLSEISSMNEERVMGVLNHSKDGDISKTSQIIIRCIEKCEEDLESVENLNTVNKNWYELSNESLNYRDGVRRYVDDNGIAEFGLPKDIFNAIIENADLYKYWFWTSASVVYSVESKKVKLVLSRDKKINKLLDYDLIKNEYEFLPATDDCSYEKVKVDNVEVFEYDWDGKLENNSKTKIIEGVDNFKDYKYPKFNIFLLENNGNTTSQWRPLIVNLDFNSSLVYANYNLLNEFRFLFLKGPSGD